MTIFLQSLGSRVAKGVTKLFSLLDGDEETWSKIANKKFDADAKAHYELLQALSGDDLSRVIHCNPNSRFGHTWFSHTRGLHKSRELRLIFCIPNIRIFFMNEDESIDDMITKFTKITDGLASLGDKIDNDQKVKKANHALPLSWEVKSITLKKLNDKDEMELIGFIGNLKIHEMKRKAR